MPELLHWLGVQGSTARLEQEKSSGPELSRPQTHILKHVQQTHRSTGAAGQSANKKSKTFMTAETEGLQDVRGMDIYI